jgi:hypothetical protein
MAVRDESLDERDISISMFHSCRSVQSLGGTDRRSRNMPVPARARCRVIVVRRRPHSFPGCPSPGRRPILVGGSSALRSAPSSAVLLPEIRGRGPVHLRDLAAPALSGRLHRASPSGSGRVRRHRRGGREHVVARTRRAAISAFPRRAVTTPSVPHVRVCPQQWLCTGRGISRQSGFGQSPQ